MKLRLKANIRTTVKDGDKKLWKLLERHGYEVIGYWDDDLGIVRLNGKWGMINTEGKVVIPLKYDCVDYFSEGLAYVKLNGKYGFVDTTGKVVIPLKYDSVGKFDEGLASVFLNGKRGFVDKTGKEVVPPKYDFIYDFVEGLAKVRLYDKFGFIDVTGKEVVPPKYDQVWGFYEGLAAVELNGKEGFVNKQGKEYWDIVEIMKHNEQVYEQVYDAILDELTEGGEWYFPPIFKGVAHPTHRFVKVGDQFLGTPEGLKAVKKSVTPEYFERRFITWQNSKTPLEILWENNKT